MGHPKSENEISSDPECFPLTDGADDKFEWTYTSPEFPMAQVGWNFIEKLTRQFADGVFWFRIMCCSASSYQNPSSVWAIMCRLSWWEGSRGRKATGYSIYGQSF